ncbi:MAG: murein L,D-transpeptidase catalytic domain family protein [Proteobacteria bacterium]|nr:murein L,D-transpeptidase catalytic domain family protein [Pseudomonadota bacterium]
MRKLHAVFISLAASTLVSCSTVPDHGTTASSSVVVPRVERSIQPQPDTSTTQLDPNAATLARLETLAPEADPGVLALALEARNCAIRNGEVDQDAKLAVIDYSRPSTDKRLWVFDVARDQLLFRELVAHGQGSGDNYATRFSNQDNSHQTSLGLFLTAETYIGNNGYSLKLDGVERGFNDNARSRAIVMHGAWYVNPEMIASKGRIGRSHGCPALNQGIARRVIDTMKGKQLLFSYANDAAWLQRGQSFACDGRSAQQIVAAARALRGDAQRVVAASAP